MASYDSLHPYRVPELPGIPFPMLDAYLNRAWFDLATQSLCWNDWSSVTLQADVASYEITPPDGGRVHLAMAAQQGSNVLAPCSLDQLMRNDAGFAERQGTPTLFRLDQARKLLLYPIPQATDTALPLRVLLAYAPALGALTIPDEFAEKYADIIASGAKAKLMAMAGKGWSNPQMAMVYQGKFDNGVAEAISERLHGGTTATITVAPRSFS